MAEADAEGGKVGGVAEEANRDDGIFGKFPFVDEEEGDDQDAEDDEAEGEGAVPGVCDAAGLHAEKEGNDATCNSEDAHPVDCFDAFDEIGLRRFDCEEEEQADKRKAVQREIDVEAPAPADFLCEGATDDGADTRRDCPYHSHNAIVLWSVSHGIEVTNANIDQNHEATSAYALDDSCSN